MRFEELTHPYFIGEIGINHNGDIQIAKKLMDAAFACNWDCVKFQKRNPDVCVPEKQKGVIRDTPWGQMTYLDYKYKVEFGKEEYDFISEYAQRKPIDWSVSVWDIDSLKFISEYNVPFIKIPSSHITNNELILEVCKTNLPIAISTGMSTISEIDKAVEIILSNSDCKPLIMHCNSSYPTPRDEMNLRNIITLQDRYDCPIGYSGHEDDLMPSSIAISLGVKVVERHITLSHELWGTDQKSSLEIMGMDMLKKRSDDIEIILGSYEKTVTKSELPIREKLRKL